MKELAARRSWRLLVVATVFAILGGGSAMAQEGVDAQDQAEAASEEGADQSSIDVACRLIRDDVICEEIVVTARRREENVLEVPLAVSAFNEEAIKDLGISSLRDLEVLIPSTTFGFDNPVTIRGVGQQAWRDASAEVGVAAYQNGLFYNENYGLLESSMFDLERVEVLRGPQGTLYGRNAMGGAMNLVNNKPQRAFGGEVLAELTTFNGQRLNAAITGPLNEVLSYRLTAGYVKRDGTAENVGSGPDAGRLDNTFLSPQIRLQTERLDFNIRYARFRADEGHIDQIFFSQPDTTMPAFVGRAGGEGAQNTHFQYAVQAPSATLFGSARYTDSVGEIKRKAVDANRRSDRTIERDVVNVDAFLELNDAWSLRYIGGASDSNTFYWQDSDFTSRVASADDPFASADAGVPFRDGQTRLAFPKEIQSNELHLTGEVGAAAVLFGVYQFNEKSPFRLRSWEFANPFLVTIVHGCDGTAPISRDCARDFRWDIDAEVESIAGFANVELDLTERWGVSGGLRYSEDEKIQSTNDFTIGTFGNFSFTEEAAQRTYSGWMGHVTTEFRPREGHLFHARYARAFRAGGFNSFTFGQTARTYGGETMDSYEAGYKGASADGRLRLVVNTYFYDYADYQQQLSYREIIGTNPVDITDWKNIDGSRLLGIEAEGQWAVSPRVRLTGMYAFTDSSLGSLLAFNASNPAQEWVAGEEGDAPANPIDLKGNPFPTLPKHQFSLSMVATMGPLELITTASYIGDRAGSIWNIPLDEMPAYSRWDIRLGWQSQDERLRLTGFVDNILDTYGVTENEARGWDEDFIREGQLTDGRIVGFEARFGF